MIAETEIGPWLLDKFEAFVDPPLPGSEQFSLQQRRAIETWGAVPVDLAVLQQRGIFAFAQVPSAALIPTAPLARAMVIIKLKARSRIPHELYLAGRTAVKITWVSKSPRSICGLCGDIQCMYPHVCSSDIPPPAALEFQSG